MTTPPTPDARIKPNSRIFSLRGVHPDSLAKINTLISLMGSSKAEVIQRAVDQFYDGFMGTHTNTPSQHNAPVRLVRDGQVASRTGAGQKLADRIRRNLRQGT